MPEPKTLYTVFVDDNFHYGDESERSTRGVYETAEQALAECKRIVDSSLESLHEPGMTSSQLMAQYVQFGEDPWIRPPPEGGFSARDYARGPCKEMCRDEDATDEASKGPRIDAPPPELLALKPVIAAALTRPNLKAEYRQALELMRSLIDAIPRTLPDRSFDFMVKASRNHGEEFFADLYNARLTPTGFSLYWGKYDYGQMPVNAKPLGDLKISFYGTGEGDKRVRDPVAILEPMVRAAADESFMMWAVLED